MCVRHQVPFSAPRLFQSSMQMDDETAEEMRAWWARETVRRGDVEEMTRLLDGTEYLG